MERLTIEEFTQFQEERVRKTPPPKCHIPLYANTTCWPQMHSDDCHACGIKQKKENKGI